MGLLIIMCESDIFVIDVFLEQAYKLNSAEKKSIFNENCMYLRTKFDVSKDNILFV